MPQITTNLDAIAVLVVSNLNVSFGNGIKGMQVVRDVSFDIRSGETLALVGESGSGKSVTSLAVIGLVSNSNKGQRVSGSIKYIDENGKNLVLTKLDKESIRKLRGTEIAMVFQEPMTALNPVMCVGEQIAEVVRSHFEKSKSQARAIAIQMLEKVGIPIPADHYHSYPHQLSGGMRQRILLAMALVCKPRLLIADEPTTALDTTIQAQILELLRDIRKETGTGILLITHDLGVVAENSDRTAVMYAGSIMEEGPTDQIISRPFHPYTQGLLRSRPEVDFDSKTKLEPIAGALPDPRAMPCGCAFHPRCNYSIKEICTVRVPLLELVGTRSVRCVRWRELSEIS